jgi:hypothetical protein
LAAINESNAPSLANPFVTMRSLSALKLVGMLLDTHRRWYFNSAYNDNKESGNTSFVKNSFDFTGQQSFILTEDFLTFFY